jgi:hypothetical protein
MNQMQSTKEDDNKLWVGTKKDPMDSVSNLPHSAANCFLVFLLLHEFWTTGLRLGHETSVHRTISPSLRTSVQGICLYALLKGKSSVTDFISKNKQQWLTNGG